MKMSRIVMKTRIFVGNVRWESRRKERNSTGKLGDQISGTRR